MWPGGESVCGSALVKHNDIYQRRSLIQIKPDPCNWVLLLHYPLKECEVVTISCPKCGFTVAFNSEAAQLSLEYQHDAWRAVCVHKEATSLAACPEFFDRLRAAMSAARKNGPNGRGSFEP
jgi:hypothetical protein